MSKRRGNSEGSITKRSDGRWEARISLPDGKRKSFYGDTRDEVRKKLDEARRNLEKGLLPISEKCTVDQLIAQWKEVAYNRLKPSSRHTYDRVARLYLGPSIGHLSIVKLLPQHIQSLYKKMMVEGLSPSTIHKVQNVIHQSLDYAVDLGLVYRNVAGKVRLPAVQRKKRQTFDRQQARQFLQAIVGHRLEAMFVLALTTAMREGELLALQWEDIDFENKIIHVSRSLTEDESYQVVIGDTKSSSSRRPIAITDIAISALKAHREKVEQQKTLLGSEWDRTYNLVFPSRFGRRLHPGGFNVSVLHPVLKKAGLPLMRFHDLRHSAATLLLELGISPKIVSEMLGHSSVKITLDVYSHVLPHMQQSAAQAINDLLEG